MRRGALDSAAVLARERSLEAGADNMDELLEALACDVVADW